MLPENESVMLILGTGVLVFILATRSHLKRLRSWRLLVLGYILILTGWCATLAEHIVCADLFNYVEHAAYALGALVVAYWCWGGMRVNEEAS